jgi:hypothetical protein
MPFPTSPEELRTAGYELKYIRACQACGKKIEFYQTPKGKFIPMDAGTATPHFSTCAHSEWFRKKDKKS